MFKRLLIANRGEIAIRIARTAADLNVTSVMIYSRDDAASLHTRAGDEALLPACGPRPLDHYNRGYGKTNKLTGMNVQNRRSRVLPLTLAERPALRSNPQRNQKRPDREVDQDQ